MAMPMAFHAAKKVRENMNKPIVMATEVHSEQNAAGSTDWNAKFKSFEVQGGMLARRYNEKMMNAIWGLYNMNSAHNFKSRADGGNDGVLPTATQAAAVCLSMEQLEPWSRAVVICGAQRKGWKKFIAMVAPAASKYLL